MNKRTKTMTVFSLLLGVAVLAGVLCSPGAAQAQGSYGVPDQRAGAQVSTQAAAMSFFASFSGQVDHVAAGAAMRNFGSGTIRLRGIPPASTVVRAYLYWALICAPSPSGTCPTATTGQFEGHAISGNLYGSAPQPCWGVLAPIGAYRADVTGLMPATTTVAVANKVANGDYQLTGFPSGRTDGSNPWVTSTIPPLMEGATLVVIYSNPSLSGGFTFINNAPVTIIGTTADIANPIPPSIPAGQGLSRKLTRFGADGQRYATPTSTLATSTEKTWVFAGIVPAPGTQIAGPGSLIDVDSDWNGGDGRPIPELWDTRTTAFTGTGAIPSGVTSYTVRYASLGDCITPIGHVLTAR